MTNRSHTSLNATECRYFKRKVFFGLAILFALAYWLWPGCTVVYGKVGEIRGLWHAFYFSVVTMTTLGFGDIAANPGSWVGQTLLMFQVILAELLMGTR